MVTTELMLPSEQSPMIRQLRALPAQMVRKWILDLEAFLDSLPEVQRGNSFPLKHSFGDGLYMREILVPAGYCLTGKIHKFMNPNFLLSGEMLMATEYHGVQRLIGPCVMMCQPGEKRAVIAITDIWFVTVHANPTDCTDFAQIEQNIFALDYDEYQRFKEARGL